MSYSQALRAIQVYVLSGSDTVKLYATIPKRCPEISWRLKEMGLKAVGAAQGYTVLGGLVLLVYAIERIYFAMTSLGLDTIEGLIEILLGIVLVVMVALSFDACGFVSWKVQKSGALLSAFGFIIILIVSFPGITLDPLTWLRSLYTLAGLMILLGGLLLVFRE